MSLHGHHDIRQRRAREPGGVWPRCILTSHPKVHKMPTVESKKRKKPTAGKAEKWKSASQLGAPRSPTRLSQSATIAPRSDIKIGRSQSFNFHRTVDRSAGIKESRGIFKASVEGALANRKSIAYLGPPRSVNVPHTNPTSTPLQRK